MCKLAPGDLILSSTIWFTIWWVYFHYELPKWHPSFILPLWPVEVIVLGWTMRMHEFACHIFVVQINCVDKDYPPVPIVQARCIIVWLKGLLHLLRCGHHQKRMVFDHKALIITELFSPNRSCRCRLEVMTASSTCHCVSFSISLVHRLANCNHIFFVNGKENNCLKLLLTELLHCLERQNLVVDRSLQTGSGHLPFDCSSYAIAWFEADFLWCNCTPTFVVRAQN